MNVLQFSSNFVCSGFPCLHTWELCRESSFIFSPKICRFIFSPKICRFIFSPKICLASSPASPRLPLVTVMMPLCPTPPGPSFSLPSFSKLVSSHCCYH